MKKQPEPKEITAEDIVIITATTKEAKLVPHFFWAAPCFHITHADEALGMEEIRSRPCPTRQVTAATCLAQMSHTLNHSKLQETVNSMHTRIGRVHYKKIS